MIEEVRQVTLSEYDSVQKEVKTLQDELIQLRAWKAQAQTSLTQWHELGELLQLFFPLRIGENMPQSLTKQIKATAYTFKRMLNL